MESNQNSQVSDEQQDQAKQILFETFLQLYKNLTSFLDRLPFHPVLRDKMMNGFDTGFLWGKEAFVALDVSPKKEPEKTEEPQTNVPDGA